MPEHQLVRRLGLVSATAIVVSNMIGAGIFTTTGFLAGQLGSPTTVVSLWFVGAAIAFLGAICYAELGANFPRSGGEYVYLTEAFGPAWGFVDGWVTFFAGFSAPIAVAAIGISAYLAYFNPALDPTSAAGDVVLGPLTLHLGPGRLAACLVVVAFTLLNLVGVETVARMQNGLTGIKLLVLSLFLLLGFAVGTGDWGHFAQPAERTSELALPAQFLISLIFVYWAYSGWNAAIYVAEEIRDPEVTLPRSLLLGTTIVAVFYALLNALYIYATPLEEMKGVIAVGSQAAESLFGERGGGWFSGGMALSLLATVNAMCLIGPRVYYAMAKDGAFFSFATAVHPRWKSPWAAVVAQGVCCCVLIVTNAFESLLYYIGFLLWLFSAIAAGSIFRLRARPGWRKLRWTSIAYPLAPGLYVAVNALVFLYFSWDKGSEAAWALGTVAAAWLAFHARKRAAAKPY